ncbi:MAG: hypothetical protein IPH16_21240 [Haliscomenobacter sp.]|nr:hypothetical protein [Haliscomenobacter sp.]
MKREKPFRSRGIAQPRDRKYDTPALEGRHVVGRTEIRKGEKPEMAGETKVGQLKGQGYGEEEEQRLVVSGWWLVVRA